jgi:predicted RNA-binding protein associated with RNAse of E/G family
VRGQIILPPDRVIGELTFTFVRPPDRRASFRAHLLRATPELIVVAHRATPSRPLEDRGQIVLDAGYLAVWFLFNGRPYDVGRFYRPDGTWTGYYVDVLEPVRWEGADPTTLAPIVDLFLDLWIAPDGRCVVLDEDEFDAAIGAGRITGERAAFARGTLRALVEAAARGAFPPEPVKTFRISS